MSNGEFYPGLPPQGHSGYPGQQGPGSGGTSAYPDVNLAGGPPPQQQTYEGDGSGDRSGGERGLASKLAGKAANKAMQALSGSTSSSASYGPGQPHQGGHGGYPNPYAQHQGHGGGHGGSYGQGYGHGPGSPQQQQGHHRPHVPHNVGGGRCSDGRRRKALLIGCNYPGTRAALSGCCNDAVCIEYLLRHKFEYRDIRLLRDDGRGGAKPTRANILAHIDWLVGDARAGDTLFFHFSGHGSQKRDFTGDERDGLNETICPTDFMRAGQIIDDTLNERLVRRVPKGCILHALLDACHSGTGMDLPFVAMIDRRSEKMYWTDERGRYFKGTSGGLAIQFGACKDSQTAADTAGLSADRTSTGAATFLFIQAVERLSKHHQALTYANVLAEMLHQIKEFNQRQGRGVDGDRGSLMGSILQMALSEAVGGGGGSGLMGTLAGRAKGQTPQLSASEQFNLNSKMCL